MHWFERHLAVCIVAVIASLVVPGIWALRQMPRQARSRPIEKAKTIPMKRVKKSHD